MCKQRLLIAQAVTGAAGSWEWDIAEDRLYGDARFASLCGARYRLGGKGVAD